MLQDDIREFVNDCKFESNIENKGRSEKYLAAADIYFLGLSQSKLKRILGEYLKDGKANMTQVQIEKIIYELMAMEFREFQYSAIIILQIYYKGITAHNPIDGLVDRARDYPYGDTINSIDYMVGYYFNQLDKERKKIYINKGLNDGNYGIQMFALQVQFEYNEEQFDGDIMKMALTELLPVSIETNNKGLKQSIAGALQITYDINPDGAETFIKEHTIDKQLERFISTPMKKKNGR